MHMTVGLYFVVLELDYVEIKQELAPLNHSNSLFYYCKFRQLQANCVFYLIYDNSVVFAAECVDMHLL